MEAGGQTLLETHERTVCFQDEDSEAILAADFEIGHFIRERIVPRAVLYFTGEAIEDDDDDVSTISSWVGVTERCSHKLGGCQSVF